MNMDYKELNELLDKKKYKDINYKDIEIQKMCSLYYQK